jgi:hypothetical protein
MLRFVTDSERSGKSASGLLSFLFGIGFFWFAFLSPETVNAEIKANYCLVAAALSVAGYLWFRLQETKTWLESEEKGRNDDRKEQYSNESIRNLHHRIDRLEERSDRSKCNNGGGVCMGDSEDTFGL